MKCIQKRGSLRITNSVYSNLLFNKVPNFSRSIIMLCLGNIIYKMKGLCVSTRVLRLQGHGQMHV